MTNEQIKKLQSISAQINDLKWEICDMSTEVEDSGDKPTASILSAVEGYLNQAENEIDSIA